MGSDCAAAHQVDGDDGEMVADGRRQSGRHRRHLAAAVLARLAVQDDHRRGVVGNSGCPGPGHLDGWVAEAAADAGRPAPRRNRPRRTARTRRSTESTSPHDDHRIGSACCPGPPGPTGGRRARRCWCRWRLPPKVASGGPLRRSEAATGSTAVPGQSRQSRRRPPADGRRSRLRLIAGRPSVSGEEMIAVDPGAGQFPAERVGSSTGSSGLRADPEHQRRDGQAALVDQTGGGQLAEQLGPPSQWMRRYPSPPVRDCRRKIHPIDTADIT